MMMLMRAGIKEKVSKICSTLKPAKETINERIEITTMPVFGVMVPDDIADKHCPPTTQMMALNPDNVAKLNRTGIETRYRLQKDELVTNLPSKTFPLVEQGQGDDET